MDHRAALFLNRMTCDFYRNNAMSFSATRQSPWDGWRRLAGNLHGIWDTQADLTRTVVDLACGNLRFERFLTTEFPDTPFAFRSWDNCDELVSDTLGRADSDITLAHHRTDIVEELISPAAPRDPLGSATLDTPAGEADLAVCFGFFHHIPTPEARARALKWLLGSVRAGGIVAISLWRFADDDRARAKAEQTTGQALSTLTSVYLASQLDPGDYLLSWQGDYSSFRYCHSFSDDEADSLVAAAQEQDSRIHLVARYRADGKNSRSNEYLVFRKEGRA